ncbi:MAG: serine/threonine protein kinase [Myxococcales bacterium]|nr:serine/threonine protein kinase [Myxococcales bacterium]
MIGTRVGNYEIKEKLGEGGMGVVYLGQHPLIGKRVAVKVLLEDYVANETIAMRFFNEAKAVNDIRHQNIVDIVDFGKVEKPGGGFIIYIVMELLEGQSLAARLDTRRLGLDEVQHIMKQCCSGLAASHAKGIIHRDLKPDNLFLVPRSGDENFLKILDFGIAKLTATSETNAKTRTGTLIGTPAYMSPEQCAGRSKIDARSDVYALGIVMYEMLTGHVPFKGEGFGDIVVAQITEEAKLPSTLRPDLPPEWDALVMRAIEKEPDRRFQSMEEFGVALSDPQKYLTSPGAVAFYGSVAAAHTTSVPAMTLDEKSGAHGPVAVSSNDAATLVATKKKRDTTLSAAASEVRSPSGSRKRVAVISSTVGVVVLGAAAALLLRPTTASVPAPQPVVTQAPVAAAAAQPVAAAAKPESVVVKLVSEPAGATVLWGDKILGSTPFELTMNRGEPSRDVQLKFDGYRPEMRTLASDANREIGVNLVRLPSSTKRPGKATAVKGEPKPEPTKAEPTRAEPTKPEPTKPEPAKAEPAKPVDEDKKLVAPEL